jgi:DNA-directed RNA polymerase subunit RPC12/RpoP
MQQEISCPNCGARNPVGQRFCGNCGATISEDIPSSAEMCPGCGSPITTNQRYCGVCGTQLSGVAQAQAKTAQHEPSVVAQPKTVTDEKASAVSKQTKPEKSAVSKTPAVRYGLLNFCVIIFRIVGWILLAGGCLGSIAVIVFAIIGGGFQTIIPGMGTLTGDSAVWLGVGCLIFSFVYGLAFIAFAELCRVVTVIASNTSGKK